MATTMAWAPPTSTRSTANFKDAAAMSSKTSATVFDFQIDDASLSAAAVSVERDEEWVQQLEAEQEQRILAQAQVMHKELLQQLENAGPFAGSNEREALQRRYDEALEHMRAMQQDELEQHIEMERQERLWSLGLQDEHWDGWNRVRQEQASILAKIRRDAVDRGEKSTQEMIWENEREDEELRRRNDEWLRTESQRLNDRHQWATGARLTSQHNAERRQRDTAEAIHQERLARAREEKSTRLGAEAREGAAQLQARKSQAALGSDSDSGRPFVLSPLSESSMSDSLFDSGSAATETPPSSMFSSDQQRWRPGSSSARPVPIPRSSPAPGSMSGSPPSRARASGMATPSAPSPLSGTPTSNTMAYAKVDGSPHPTRWVPPEGAGGPTRKGSVVFDATREPAKKSSMLFGASPLPSPSPTLDEPSKRPTQAQQSSPFPPPNTSAFRAQQSRPSPSPQPPLQAPHAPPSRSQPLPQMHSHSQPQFTPVSASQSRPSASYVSQPTPGSAGRTSSAPKANPAPNTGSRAVPTPTNAAPKAGSTPMRAGQAPKATPTSSRSSGDDEYRTRMRDQYVGGQQQREEEERRRRTEEMNEQRAEEARRRGAEKRRAEEQAREAERREAERKARAMGKSAHGPPVPEKSIPERWAAYETQWEAMAAATQLSFRSIPWPVLTSVSAPEMLLPIHIAAFILHPLHSNGKSRKDRLRDALLRWHPDRFETKWLRKVMESDREAVKEGVGLVACALNELNNKDGLFSD